MSRLTIVAQEGAFLVVDKPPRLHTVPLKRSAPRGVSGSTLLDYWAQSFPEIRSVRGPNPWEGGVLHRLDYETSGLVLIARTQAFYDALRRQQEEGRFVKSYAAMTRKEPCPELPSGFPPGGLPGLSLALSAPGSPSFRAVVESDFRPWGPGRKSVRPVPVEASAVRSYRTGRLYRTEITGLESAGDRAVFHLRLCRGFRHQIRCHLAWLGYPLLGDQLYGPPGDHAPELGLRAEGLSFYDLEGDERRYTLAGPPVLQSLYDHLVCDGQRPQES